VLLAQRKLKQARLRLIERLGVAAALAAPAAVGDLV